MKMMPKVVIIGRTNVGKSSFFNRIAPRVKSLTFDQEGVTRDFVNDVAEWNGVTFELIDTGGIDLCRASDEMTCRVTEKVEKVLGDAALFLFVVDVTTGITDQDIRIAKKLHGLKKPILLIVNKADSEQSELEIYNFKRLGCEDLLAVSTVHGKGVADVLDWVVEKLRILKLDKQTEREESEFRVAFLGRPNAGKSSLINLLVKEDFSIVSPIAGTTREALRKKVAFNKKMIELIDTAGVRKKSSVSDDLESMMVTNALQTAKRAHIVLLVIDVQEPELTAQELKLTSYAFDNGSAVIILFNKIDLLDEEKKQYLESSLDQYKYFVDKLESLRISCKTNKNVGKVLPLIQTVWEKYNIRLSERYLTDLFFDALMRTPLYSTGQRLNFYGAKQVGAGPLRIELLVSPKQLFQKSHITFFENVLRKNQDLKSVPVFFYLKEKKERKK